MKAILFDHDDSAYLDWIAINPDGFVLNTRRTNNLNYNVLHKGTCHHIKTTTNMPEGAYTTRNYIKVCANDVQEIKNWLMENRRGFTERFRICKTCGPLV